MSGNEKSKPRVFIATPHNNLFPWEYVWSLARTYEKLGQRYELGVQFVESAMIHANRNKLMQTAYDNQVDYMIYIDSDMAWQPEQIERLLDFDRDAVTAVCYSRKPIKGNSHMPAVFQRYGDMYEVITENADTPFKIDASGLAFMVLKRAVIEKLINLKDKIGFPFDMLTSDEAGLKKSDTTALIGEDVSFSQRLNKCGFDIWCLPDVVVGHITRLRVPLE